MKVHGVLLSTLASVVLFADGLKLGAIFHTTGVGAKGARVVDIFKAWANDASNKAGYSVTTTIKNYSSSTLAADVKSLIEGANAVDVLFCPYTSGASKACATAVNGSIFQGPIMIWGGADDAIFATDGPCMGKNCFGFFTLASTYMRAGLEAVAAAYRKTLRVALMVNNNAFSRSVAAGANESVKGTSGLVLQTYTEFSTYDSLDATGVGQVSTAMRDSPDVVLVAGHNGNVEPVVIEIAKSGRSPKVVIATNGLTKMSNYDGATNKPYNCLLMPEQWAKPLNDKDPVLGWTTKSFQTAVDGDATTYHSAAAGAAVVAIANAMKANSNVSALATGIAALKIPSFYGNISFTFGTINKPMYMVQWQGNTSVVVAPKEAATAKLQTFRCNGELGAGENTHTINAAVGATPFPLIAVALVGLLQAL
eukprot:TRINITY_DN14161_c0_g2_i1.p1 TRINITY_DN14161_c0_g2~~TRINITY_DN14161_c0_g2_i1.p1  ORF type:complete len:448 (-),score=63.79 TRINITY_DN14161_c0_g2_i1:159-1427(-)